MSIATVRSLALLRKCGFHATMVERWIPAGQFGLHKDFFGFGDILAFRPSEPGNLVIQSFTTKVSYHVALLSDPLFEGKPNPVPGLLREWLTPGMFRRFEMWSWRKLGKAGRRKLYKVRRLGFTLDGPMGLKVMELGDGDNFVAQSYAIFSCS